MREAKRIQQAKRLKRVGGKAKTTNRLQAKRKQDTASWQRRNERRERLQKAHQKVQDGA